MRASELIGCDTLLRPPGQNPDELGRYADLWPSMLMVPMIDTAEQAAAVVRGTRFPPLGNRSYGGRRPIDLMGRDYFEKSEVAFAAQIETPEAVKNAEAIAAVPGVDVLFHSPDDMKLRLGLPINTPPDAEVLRESMVRVAARRRRGQVLCACAAPTPAAAAYAIEMGYQMLTAASEVSFIRGAAPQLLAGLRAVTGTAGPTTTAAAAKAGGNGQGVY